MASEINLREAKDPIGGRNVLHFAAAKGHLEICRFLVEESGLDVNCTTASGECAALLNLAHQYSTILPLCVFLKKLPL
jgi:ankyrin repeat protein